MLVVLLPTPSLIFSMLFSASAVPIDTRLPVGNGVAPKEVSAVVEHLVWAQSKARGSEPLTFQLKCSDEQQSGICAEGGRKALATLPLDRVRVVSRIYNTSCVRVVFEYPGDVCPPHAQSAPRRVEAYEISLPLAAGGGFTWTVGLAPADGVEIIVLERGMVFYH